jgi:hypothetical protein
MIILSRFTGSIDGNTLLVGDVQAGSLAVGHVINGDHVPSDVRITALGTAQGTQGTYALNRRLPLGVATAPMTSGAEDLVQASLLVPVTTRYVVPLLAVPAQTLTVSLNGINCNINVYQRTTGLYVDLGRDGNLIIGGVLALDRCKIVRDAYLGFTGDLAFWDSQGTEDPNWTELNTRYFLGYFAPT